MKAQYKASYHPAAFTETLHEPRGNLGVPMDISSPITSDEEYLSPLEEGMDFGGPEPMRNIDTRFRCPPSFLVRYTFSFCDRKSTCIQKEVGQTRKHYLWKSTTVLIQSPLQYVFVICHV